MAESPGLIIESSTGEGVEGITAGEVSGVNEVGVIVWVGTGGGGGGGGVSTGTPGAAGKDEGVDVAVGVVFVFDGVGKPDDG